MQPIITDADDALNYIKAEIQADLPPEVTDTEINAKLARNLRAGFWLASTAYTIGQEVLPTTRNGHRYICVQAGTTADTEPVWLPTYASDRYRNSSVGSGSAIFQENGTDGDGWDLDMVIWQCWLLKKSKAVVYIGTDLAEIYEHCKEMAELAKPTQVA